MALLNPMEVSPSPNHGPRADGGQIDILLMHYTQMESGEAALKWLCDPRSNVSSHYLVFEDGGVVRLVDEERRAYHAGVSVWAGETDINSRSIGIEIVNPGHEGGYRPFPPAQIDALIALSRAILSRHPIPPERVLAHSDVAPLRKQDPGELFPWQQLHDEGVGYYLTPVPPGDEEGLMVGDRGAEIVLLKTKFRQYGYGLVETDEFDREMEAVVSAFQRHFRPARIDGIADASTQETLGRLLAALPRRSAHE
jgi:N-acetylmuramoyl-L-alanine amidase